MHGSGDHDMVQALAGGLRMVLQVLVYFCPVASMIKVFTTQTTGGWFSFVIRPGKKVKKNLTT